jgi:ankyrin repeat protein
MSVTESLFDAARTGDHESLGCALSSGCDVDTRNEDRATPLMYAVANDQLVVVRLLIRRVADVNASDKNKSTVLHRLRRASVRLVEDLLDAGADVDARDKGGRTPLMYVVVDHRPEIAALLIERGADVNARDKQRFTALHFAAQEGQLEIAKMLIEHGAAVDPKDKWGDTALWRAVSNFGGTDTTVECNGELIRLLLAHGADRDLKNNYGISPWESAKMATKHNIVQYFG